MTAITDERSETSRLHTIGAVCQLLRAEFPDISISKIRYLEDQGLLAPRRTRGGYRLFSDSDVDRLETILRLQRDEFLPLRVIKQELAQRVGVAERRRRSASLREPEPEIALNELCERADVTPELVRQLEEFGLLSPRLDGGERWYRESEADIAAASAQLSRYGIDARHLRAFRTAAGRQSALLEQLVAPALRSRNPDRRKDALDDLDQLSTISQALAQLLFLRDLRELIDR